jgi:glyoxylase-like metal-dependent hydrolase (beta-lactamase superfamily II)
MRTSVYLLAALLLGTAALVGLHRVFSARESRTNSSASPRPELEYLKAVNSVAPPRDPQLLFLLMAQYSNANLQGEGAEFFSARLKEFGPRLTDAQKALYLSAIGLLRAQHASSVSLLHRIGYVKDTIAILDQAKQLSGGQVYVVNWIAGIVRTELPGFFHQRKAAEAELAWCLANVDKAPHAGWLREVYYHLGKLALADGEQAKAQDYLRESGYKSFDRPITLITPFSEDVASGHAFSPRRIAEIVPGRVYALSGFEFTEYYFVVSDDGRQLIGIDAGTRADSAKVAYEALRAYAPNLPELTTVFITHSHWDHIGGQAYFRALSPRVRFYARSNYAEEIAHDVNQSGVFDKRFFGERFSLDDVRSFKPDITIDRRTELKIGGTRIELIPVQGGETHDAMFIHLPDQGVMFVGDFIMPYLGAPFVEEGDFQGLLDAIDVVVEKHPQFLLHGHEPLTRNFASSSMLAQLKTDLVWLQAQVLTAVRRGDERATIYQANLIPPGLLGGQPDVYQPYLILREHVIDRLYDQNVGYWQPDLQGLDHLGRADRAELLVDYLGVSEKQLVRTDSRLELRDRFQVVEWRAESI